LPLSLQKLYTYHITEAEATFLQKGMRVAVPFGKSKIYTALVKDIHQHQPIGYKAKEIYQILDNQPIVTVKQLTHWQWIADYYMCSLGEVFKSSVPSALLLESETLVNKNLQFTEEGNLSDDEFLIYEALQYQSTLPIKKISEILNKKNVLPTINKMLAKKAIVLKEEIVEQYKPKLVKYIKLAADFTTDNSLNDLLIQLKNAKRQRDAVMNYFAITAIDKKPVSISSLTEKSGVSTAIIKALINKKVFEDYYLQVDRVNFGEVESALKELTNAQQQALTSIKEQFKNKEVLLLKGITSSGKTEVYTRLIEETINKGKQVLYLLPEIALTTQLINRLKKYFADKISVYHSKYSLNERVEVWNNLLQKKQKTTIILGARSSLLLPFSNLGLIIVDEEHETSFKQFDPAPRYHARDAAIVLNNIHHSKLILGSATPSIESYYNVKNKKYGFTSLNERYGNVLLPEIKLVNIKEKLHKKRMNGHFSDTILSLMQEAFENKEQIIIFQNRRGFSPIVECQTCGVSPQCPNCDVSLTYHKYTNELKCHYCGFHTHKEDTCFACGSPNIDTKGFGTEQLEIELKSLFPSQKIGRMDLDTTRGKYAYEKIISNFQNRDIDVLVGTQMLAKGLDFKNVTLVGVLNADNMLNFPDFRAHERAFQLMVQVAGRAGRAQKRGKVIIQTYNPHHKILQQIISNTYDEMYTAQMQERLQYKYPPINRIIKFTLKDKNSQKVNEASNWLGKSLTNSFNDDVLGPTSPSIARIRNQYLKNILLKLPKNNSIYKSKEIIRKISNSFKAIAKFRSVRLIIDVDNY